MVFGGEQRERARRLHRRRVRPRLPLVPPLLRSASTEQFDETLDVRRARGARCSFSSRSASSTRAGATSGVGRVRAGARAFPRRATTSTSRRGASGLPGLEAATVSAVTPRRLRAPSRDAASARSRRGRRTEVDVVGDARGRADLALFHEFAPPPSGGGHQFLRALDARARGSRARWSSRTASRAGRRPASSTRSTSTSAAATVRGARARAWCTASTARSASTAGSTTARTRRSRGSTPSSPSRRPAVAVLASRSTASSGSSCATRS